MRRAALFVHGFLEELRVELEADRGDVAVLFGAENVPGPADLEVLHRDLESRPELARLEHRLQALASLLVQVLLLRVKEVRVGLLGASPDAAAELVELGQAKLTRAVDHDRVHVRDVEPGLDDRGADEYVVLGVGELDHDPLEPSLVHLPVRDDVAGLRHELPQTVCLVLDPLHAVVDVVDLTAAVELAQDRLAQHVVASLHDVGLDRLTVLGRRLDHADVSHARERHVQRARDRRSRQREDVDVRAELLQPLLVTHAEPVFFVDDDDAEVAELHILLEHAVRPDHDVDLARAECVHDAALLSRRAEARQHGDPHREGGEPLGERLVVLLREHRRRHDDCHLLAVHDRLEGGAERDLGLSVTDITHDQPVHGPPALHVALDVLDRLQLVGRLGVGESVLHLDLPGAVPGEGEAGGRLARGVEAQKLAGDLLGGLLRLALGDRPVASAEGRERGGRAADVARDPVDALGRQGDDVGAGEAQLQVLAHDSRDLARDEALESGDAVVLMHDVVARLEVREEGPDVEPTPALLRVARLTEAEHLGVGEHAELELGDREPLGERDPRHHQRARRGTVRDSVAGDRGDVPLGEQLREPRRLRRRDKARVMARRRHVTEELVEPSRVARDARPAEPHRVRGRPHARAAVPLRDLFDPRSGDVRRRKDARRQARCGKLVASLLCLCLQRIPRELELDGVLEDHRRAIAEVIEQ